MCPSCPFCRAGLRNKRRKKAGRLNTHIMDDFVEMDDSGQDGGDTPLANRPGAGRRPTAMLRPLSGISDRQCASQLHLHSLVFVDQYFVQDCNAPWSWQVPQQPCSGRSLASLTGYSIFLHPLTHMSESIIISEEGCPVLQEALDVQVSNLESGI